MRFHLWLFHVVSEVSEKYSQGVFRILVRPECQSPYWSILFAMRSAKSAIRAIPLRCLHLDTWNAKARNSQHLGHPAMALRMPRRTRGSNRTNVVARHEFEAWHTLLAMSLVTCDILSP